ncbi:anther-specific protein BCP1-like [Sesamum indicum]|uniref:Anther-specific protein BCP1-like n=1 Tax=Sesamum indicum TaxID=4182 RepID=A0A6I9U9P3_SESIN|nr:anther-specific protein BCP1-like [Sesamum indicum]
MANQIVAITLVFFAVVGMASAADSTPSVAPSSSGFSPGELADGPILDNVIGTVTGAGVTDAAPVGGPVPDGAFPNLAPAPTPANGATALGGTAVAGAIAAAGVVGAVFF